MLPQFMAKEPIHKGWSVDQKFRVTDADGTSYLLRVTPLEKSAGRESLFRLQQQVAALGVPMCQPVDFSIQPDGVYRLQTWIDGQDAEDVLPGLTQQEQYNFGLDAGRILTKIHSIPAPPDQHDWETWFNRKMDRKIQMAQDCSVPVPGRESLTDYINTHRRLLAGRPQSFQHGDYHTGNMMISHGQLFIIDFDRHDFGDPWEEFNRIVWAAQLAPSFACGVVDGYFDGQVPPDFWPLLALYISSNTLSSVPWAIPFGQAQVDVMLRQTADVLQWYAGMTRTTPSWYCPENLAGSFHR